jgi:tyrosinase
MDLLIYAWDYIQKQEPDEVMKHLIDNPKTNSFFTIASFHGEPFRGAGYGNPNWWGGYCNHGNILFPTWHRAYLLCLEDALRRVNYNGINCKDVALPYWNQLSGSNPDKPIPWIFLNKKYTYQTILKNGRNKTTIDNPLYSYRFQKPVHDRLRPIPDADYSKPNGYETVRYPFSGLVGDSDASTTESHNDLMKMLGEEKTTDLLQSNVSNWLLDEVMNDKGQSVGGHTQDRYIQSLFVPYYTVYSNLTSAQQYNDDNFSGNSEEDSEGDSEGNSRAAVPIESPHNAIHLAVGGFEIPNYDYSFVPGANGDMGENDTASFDPIFFFHHCFIDLMFWAWQLKNKHENELSIRDKYPGTNSVDNQGPTPGTPGGTWLNLNTPLNPFTNRNGTPVTSNVSASISIYLFFYIWC